MNTTAEIIFTNPRRLAVFHDWPAGSSKTKCEFAIQVDDLGRERALRWTTSKPATTAWFDRVRIVDGSDSKTYVIAYRGDFDGYNGVAVIYPGNFRSESVTLKNGESDLWFAIRELCYC